MKLLLIEDNPVLSEEMIAALRDALSDRGEAIAFSSVGGEQEGLHEDRLRRDLTDPTYSDTALLVVDCDLSGLNNYRGLSEPTVWRIAGELALPECGYARGGREDQFIANAETHESKIVVSLKNGVAEFASDVVEVAEGFVTIGESLKSIDHENPTKTLGEVLAYILEKPEYTEKIKLYASGDQNRLANYRNKATGNIDLRKRWACTLGYWLWDSILRYPGLFVNRVACSSYLDIHQDAFIDEVQDIFAAALYSGPFSGAKERLWWRGVLDDLLSESDVTSGREYASDALGRELPRSECSVDPSISAGYYCMINNVPVSAENSRSGLTWFPRGADLARISNTAYEEIGPWL